MYSFVCLSTLESSWVIYRNKFKRAKLFYLIIYISYSVWREGICHQYFFIQCLINVMNAVQFGA